jgi:hypothetical protein
MQQHLKEMKKVIFPLLFLMIILSCSINTEQETSRIESEQEIEKKKIENDALATLALIEYDLSMEEYKKSPITYFLKVNIDSVKAVWSSIHKDSAELGLIYMQGFDSLYYSKKSELLKKEPELIKNLRLGKNRKREGARKRIAASNGKREELKGQWFEYNTSNNTASQKLKAPWKEPSGSDYTKFGRIIVKYNITGCGEYYINEVANNEFIIACRENESTWKYYITWPLIGKIYAADNEMRSKLSSPY